MENQTAAYLPTALDNLRSALSALPSSLTSANLTLLSSLLDTLSADLSPALPSLSAVQQEALLTNTTYLTSQLSQLSALTAQIPAADVAAASPADLVAIIEIGTTRYDVLTVWAPELWAVVLAFAIAAGLKATTAVLVRRGSVRRAQEVLDDERQGGAKPSRVEAEQAVKRPAKSALGHLLNLTLGTFALVLQLLAWRLFVLPSTPYRFSDIRYLLAAIKVLLVGYAADLLFGDLRPEILLHHFFTLALLGIGEIAAFQTKSPKFFRLAQWLILQATTEQSTYFAMACYHLSTYYRAQGSRPTARRRLLTIAYYALRFTRWITFPQKIVPAAFAFYWLARMWTEIDDMAWGKTWIIWCTTILSLLMVLQIKFSDDVWPLAAHLGYKLHGGALPPRRGPVMGFLFGSCASRKNGDSHAYATVNTGAGFEAESGELGGEKKLVGGEGEVGTVSSGTVEGGAYPARPASLSPDPSPPAVYTVPSRGSSSELFHPLAFESEHGHGLMGNEGEWLYGNGSEMRRTEGQLAGGRGEAGGR
ncbi:hypothetical protein JCM10207_007496 [Rhodosporidiobolus poonsookiae]